MAHQQSSQNGSAVAEKCDPPTEDGAALAEKLIRGALPWEEHGAAPDALRPASTPQITDERPARAAQSFEMALAPATPESLSPREPEPCSASASPDDSAASSSAYSVDDLSSSRSQSVTSTPTDRHATSLRELLSRDHPQSAPPLQHQQQQGTGLSARRRSHRFSSGCTSVPTETLTYPGVQALRRQGSLSLARRLHSSCDNLTSLDYTAPQTTTSAVPPPPVAAERSSGPKRHSLGDRRHSVGEPSGDSRTSTEYTTTTTAHMRNSQGRRVSVSLRKREVPPPPPANPAPYHRTSTSLTHNPRAPPIKPRHQESRERRSKLSSIKDDIVKNKNIKNDGKAKAAVKVRAEGKKEGKAESKALSKAAPDQEAGELFSFPGLVDAVTSVFSQFISCSCEVPDASSSRRQ